MTSKEAIKILTDARNILVKTNEIYGMHDFAQAHEAYTLAIKALMAYRDCRHCTHNIKVGNMRGCAVGDCDFEDMRGKNNEID